MKFIIIIIIGEHFPECIFPFIHSIHSIHNISPERPFAKKRNIVARASKLVHSDLRVCAVASFSAKKKKCISK